MQFPIQSGASSTRANQEVSLEFFNLSHRLIYAEKKGRKNYAKITLGKVFLPQVFFLRLSSSFQTNLLRGIFSINLILKFNSISSIWWEIGVHSKPLRVNYFLDTHTLINVTEEWVRLSSLCPFSLRMFFVFWCKNSLTTFLTSSYHVTAIYTIPHDQQSYHNGFNYYPLNFDFAKWYPSTSPRR